jgi:hypothetical protein
MDEKHDPITGPGGHLNPMISSEEALARSMANNPEPPSDYARGCADGLALGQCNALAAFTAGLKAHLRETGRHWMDPDDHAWAWVDAAIDAFAAEFQKGSDDDRY